MINLNHLHDLCYLRAAAGLTVAEFCRRYGVSHKTWHRWKDGAAPAHVYRCLRYDAGHLPGWDGFRVLPSGVIYTPANEVVHKQHVDAFRYLLRLFMDGQPADVVAHVHSILEAA